MTAEPGTPDVDQLRAVLDTSTLFSAHRHWLWLLAHLGYYEGVWSTFIVNELVRVRVEHSIARGVPRAIYRRRINDLVHLLSDVLRVADYRSVATSRTLRDPDDEPILAAALASDAEIVVTLNTRDLPSGTVMAGVQFLTPEAFLERIVLQNPDGDIERRVRDADRTLP